MNKVNSKVRYLLVVLCFFVFVCTFVCISRIVGFRLDKWVESADSAVKTSLIVGVELDSASDVVFEGSTEEIKKLEYAGKEYLGYVKTKEYPNFEAFSSHILDSVASNNIFRGVAVKENVGTGSIIYNFSAEVNKFNMALPKNVSIALFEITMPGRLCTDIVNGCKVIDNTVSIDLLNTQGTIVTIIAAQGSPYSFYYNMLFFCSLVICGLTLFLFIMIIRVQQRPDVLNR